ncbi:MAG: MFS transporter [Chloroflexi bacterium]|nr:MFS transporter [Chloroflexota bacterium]
MQRDRSAAVALEAAQAFPWPILGASLLVQTAASFPNQGLSPLAPFLQGHFGLTREQIGLLTTALFLGSVFATLPAGWAADRFGVRRMFGAGLGLIGAGVVAMAVSPGYAVLLVSTAFSGVGNGIALPPTTRAIMNWFPQRTRAVAMSIKQTGVALAGAIVAWTLPVLAMAWGWRGALVAIALVALLAAAVSYAVYRDPGGARGEGARAARPRMATIFRSRPLVLASCAAAIYGLVQLTLVGFMVLFLTEVFRYPVVLAGVLLGWAQMAGVVARVMWGALSDAVFGGRRRVVLTIIGVLTTCVTLSLSLLPADAPLWLVAALVVSVGLSAIGWNGVHMTFVAEVAGRELSASAAAFSLMLTYIGIMVGPPLFGRIVDATGSYTVGLQALAALTALAVLILQTVRVERGRVAGT